MWRIALWLVARGSWLWYLKRENRGAIGDFEFKGIKWSTLGTLVAGLLTHRQDKDMRYSRKGEPKTISGLIQRQDGSIG